MVIVHSILFVGQAEPSRNGADFSFSFYFERIEIGNPLHVCQLKLSEEDEGGGHG